jgi:hypothetical protein
MATGVGSALLIGAIEIDSPAQKRQWPQRLMSNGLGISTPAARSMRSGRLQLDDAAG